MINKNYFRWGMLILAWGLLLFFPWWLWLVIVIGLAFKFSYYWEIALPALWYDIIFGLADTERWGTQFLMTFAVLIIVWSVEQAKKILIFYQ